MAFVRVRAGQGDVTINGKSLIRYLAGRNEWKRIVLLPLLTVNETDNYDVNAIVRGGGKSGEIRTYTYTYIYM